MNARPIFWIMLAVTAGAALVSRVGGWMTRATELIKRWEGKNLDAYLDVAGKWTIGYGHLIKPGEPFFPYGVVRSITEAQATELLEQDMAAARAAVEAGVKVPATDGERAAMVSLAFNIGRTAFLQSTLLRKFNAGDKVGAAAQFDKWIRAGGAVVTGLINRRAAERREFLS
jgi:lysozyme